MPTPVVDVVHREPGAAQPACRVVAVAPQADEVAMQLQQPRVAMALAPVERLLVAEPGALDELLALEQHRDAGRCEDHGGT